MRESGKFLGHTGCDLCGSSDAVAVYEQDDGSTNGFCWSCTSYIQPKLIEGKKIDEAPEGKQKKPREPITEKQLKYIESITGFRANGYRAISDSVLKYTGIRTELDEDNNVVCRYYPVHKEGVLVGYKRRFDPKDFSRGAIGMFGVSCDLMGMDKHRKGAGRRVLITAGEEDYAAAVQMLRQYQVTKKLHDNEPFAVVSPLTGETGCMRQIRNNMDYLDSFEVIIIGFDNDQKGREAAEQLAMILPEGKAYLMELPSKDINKCLQDGLQKQFIDCYFSAKPYSPSSIKDSADFDFLEDAIERALIPRIPLPPFLEGISDLLCGGIPLGYMVNIASGSGCVDADTEFMTPNGWKRIADYDKEEVLQFNQDGTSNFVKPYEYIKLPCESLDLVTSSHVDMCLSDEHRVVYKSEGKNVNYTDLCWMEVKHRHQNSVCGWKGKIPVSFEHQGGSGLDMTEGELRLQVAVMADGRIVKEGKDNYTQMRFSKERKYKRLIEMCRKYGLRYDDRGRKEDKSYSNGKHFEVIVWPKLSDKTFDSKYYNCSREQLEIILDEIYYWDGDYKTRKSYSTIHKVNADFVQFMCHALGYRSTISLDKRMEKYSTGWCATVTRHTSSKFTSISRSNRGKAKVEEFKTIDGYKYCFRVPSGMLVLRKNDKIFITGNSGKSTIVNECVYYWAMNSPHKVGVISLEATSGEYYTNILSRHLKCKIELIRDVNEKVNFLRSDFVREASQQLRLNENGEGRFTLLDDRGDINSVKKNIERMIKVNKCKVIVVDPLQDILDEISTEDEARFLRWQKGLLQKYNITIININHTRKNSNSQKANSRGAELNEEDMSGSSTIFKSGGINIIITRDKLAENPITRNTINVSVTKARGTGLTGSAGQLYYLSKSHTMVKMTPELKQQLEETHGMVSVEDAKKVTDVFQEIPEGFEEQDIFGDGGEVDAPFSLDD